MHGWPHEETILAADSIRLATWGFKVVHMGNCSLVGEGIDFDGRRNGLAPTTERGFYAPEVRGDRAFRTLVAEAADVVSDSDCRRPPPTTRHRHFVDPQLRGATIGIVRGESEMAACGAATAFGNRAQVRLSPAQTSGNWYANQGLMKTGIAAERSEGRA